LIVFATTIQAAWPRFVEAIRTIFNHGGITIADISRTADATT
jgi:hypothetical protein